MDPVRLTVTKETTQQLMDEVNRFLKQTPAVDVAISPNYALRTNKQNALFHVWVKEICKQSGLYNNNMFSTKSEAENYLKDILYKEACLHGYPYKRDPMGNLLEENGELVPCRGHEVCDSDFQILLDTTYYFAEVEHGFILTKR